MSVSDPSWNSIETQLKVTYPARLRSNVQVGSITEVRSMLYTGNRCSACVMSQLTRESDAAEFVQMYQEFGVADLWLNVDKDSMVRPRCGLWGA